MEALSAVGQVLVYLGLAAFFLAAMEAALYWWLYKFASPSYYLGAILIAASGGAAAWLMTEGHSLPWMAGVAAGLLAVAVMAQRLLRGRMKVAIMMLAPAFVSVALLVIYPFLFELRLAFANLNLYTIGRWLAGEPLGWAGFDNFVKVVTTSPLQTASFWDLLIRTILWTAINITFHVGFGLGLALLLNRKISGRPLYRTLLILPWAMPQVVAVLAWRGEFHPQFGCVNQLLALVGIHGINWWSDAVPVFVSCCIVNIWLGIPFMMIVFLGGLQAIPRSYYEAASIDGASKWTQFCHITLPMLKPVVVPSITLGTIWTFNNVNVIYLMTGQDGGNEHADILVSALYKSAFTYSRYSFSAAFAMVIFLILIALTMFWMKVSRGTEAA